MNDPGRSLNHHHLHSSTSSSQFSNRFRRLISRLVSLSSSLAQTKLLLSLFLLTHSQPHSTLPFLHYRNSSSNKLSRNSRNFTRNSINLTFEPIQRMSGLIGAIDKTFHKVKGDQEAAEAKHTMTGKSRTLSLPSCELPTNRNVGS